MLDTLQSGDFSPHIGKPCLLEAGDAVIETVVDAVRETPRTRRPGAAPDRRTPFYLFLRGDADCPYQEGIFTLKIEGMEEIPGVYASRVINNRPEPGSLFQASFN